MKKAPKTKTYPVGDLPIVVSRPYGYDDVHHGDNDHGDVERRVGEEVGVAEHEVPVDRVGRHGKTSGKCRQMASVANGVFFGTQTIHLEERTNLKNEQEYITIYTVPEGEAGSSVKQMVVWRIV